MLKRIIPLLVAIAAFSFAACGSSGSSVPDVGTTDTLGGELLLPDACLCHADADCKDKVEVSQCQVASCQACVCVAKAITAGTKCDDADPKTTGDNCNPEGKCVGIVPQCGDKTCGSPIENCSNCPDDCACPSGQRCFDNACIPNPVCGNKNCEPDENCENCAKDCGCPTGQACLDRVCAGCKDFCTTTGKVCGVFGGCDCGKCAVGQACDQVGHCYSSGMCGNGVLDSGEDCANCPSDAGCPTGKTCVAGKCEDCAGVCSNAGIDCGVYQACNCGDCGVCHKCKASKCQPDCDCVCYPELGPSAKECGEIEGCKCGKLAGECPEGKECWNHKCLEGCSTLCAGKECGWGEDCFCNWCDGCDSCYGNKCETADETPETTPDDTWETAQDLGELTDDDGASAKTFEGNIWGESDEDWFKMTVKDTVGHDLKAIIDLTDLAEDKDIDVEICWICAKGEVAGAKVEPTDSTMEVDPSMEGARCFVALNLWGMAEHLEFTPTCTDNGQDDSGTAYIRVIPASWYDCGSRYTLKFHM